MVSLCYITKEVLGSVRIPIQPCKDKGKSGYRWGKSGKCYVYISGDEASRKRAKAKATKQGRAIQVNKQIDNISKQGGKVQSLVFRKPKFDVSRAKSWAKSHGFKSGNVRETENTVRLQQFKPELCEKSGGMKELDTGVMAYICPISTSKSLQQEALNTMSNIQYLIKSIKNMSVNK